MKKKILALALTLALSLSLAIPAMAVEASVYESDNVRITNVIDRGDLDTDYSSVNEGGLGGVGAATGLITRYCTCIAPTTITPGAKFGDSINWHIAVYPENLPEDGDVSDLDWDTYAGYTGRELTLTEPGEYTVGFDSESTQTMCNFFITVQAEDDAAPGGNDSSRFTDVKPGDWFYEPVQWAVENNITAGTSATTFSPDMTCTTAQILTFLWRANGSPEPKAGGAFNDVSSSDYFYKAALWAKEKELVSGDAFNGNTPCTRSATVTYLWKLAGRPAASGGDFTDVPAESDYAQAVAWAVKNGVTSGTSQTTFSPDATCTRGQIVSFLYRDLKK